MAALRSFLPWRRMRTFSARNRDSNGLRGPSDNTGITTQIWGKTSLGEIESIAPKKSSFLAALRERLLLRIAGREE